MGRFLFFIVLLPLGAIAVALSVANREAVRVSLDPLGTFGPGWTVSLPLFVLLFAALAIGIVIGRCFLGILRRVKRTATGW